jgi:hypothetical protein
MEFLAEFKLMHVVVKGAVTCQIQTRKVSRVVIPSQHIEF